MISLPENPSAEYRVPDVIEHGDGSESLHQGELEQFGRSCECTCKICPDPIRTKHDGYSSLSLHFLVINAD